MLRVASENWLIFFLNESAASFPDNFGSVMRPKMPLRALPLLIVREFESLMPSHPRGVTPYYFIKQT